MNFCVDAVLGVHHHHEYPILELKKAVSYLCAIKRYFIKRVDTVHCILIGTHSIQIYYGIEEAKKIYLAVEGKHFNNANFFTYLNQVNSLEL
jgi:hypothetical protein